MHQIGPTQHGNENAPTIGCSVALSYCVWEKPCTLAPI